MAVYFDTGLLLKLFVSEANSTLVIALAASLAEPIVVSDFQLAELVTALHCKVGRREITASDAAAVEARIRREIKLGVFEWKEPNWKRIFAHTITLARTLAPATLCRTLDAMHVALALELRVKAFATLDERQRKLASAVKLVVLKP